MKPKGIQIENRFKEKMKIPKIIVIDEDKDKQLQRQSVDHSTRRKSPAPTLPSSQLSRSRSPISEHRKTENIISTTIPNNKRSESFGLTSNRRINSHVLPTLNAPISFRSRSPTRSRSNSFSSRDSKQLQFNENLLVGEEMKRSKSQNDCMSILDRGFSSDFAEAMSSIRHFPLHERL
jgi:hypothetical protein